MEDHVSKLEHMGKETVKKLQDITGAAVQSGLEISVPDNTINRGEPLPSYLNCAAIAVIQGFNVRAPRWQTLQAFQGNWHPIFRPAVDDQHACVFVLSPCALAFALC